MIIISFFLKHWRFVLLGALCSASYVFANKYIALQKEVSRQSKNFTSIISDQNYMLELKQHELKLVIAQDATLRKLLEDSLEIKEKRIQGLVKLASKSEVHYRDVLRDTVIYSVDTVIINAKTFAFEDPWTYGKGIIWEDSIDFSYLSYDTILVVNVMYKDAGWFLPRWFEKWKVRTDVANVNPHTDLAVDISLTVDK